MATTIMKLEIINRETIKPSSPTPHHLKTLNLSLIDQFAPVMYLPLILFYPNVNGVNNNLPNDQALAEKTKHLKKTLSKTLTLFYPLAGRIRTIYSIDCNDEGVEFLEAKINCPLSKILEKPDANFLRKFHAAEPESGEAKTGPLLLVQATFFQCGGMAIGLSSSHKIADASTLSMFLRSWSAMAALGSDNVVVPEFRAAELLPPTEISDISKIPGKCRTRRFVFHPEMIESLKHKSASETVKSPTRVEAVSAIIWKSVTQASRSNRGFMKTSVFYQFVNIRPRTVPPLPENLAGNVISIYPAMLDENEEDDELHVLVAKLRKGIEQVKEFYGRKLDVEEVKQAILECGKLIADEDMVDSYNCSSWLRFPIYETDFGFGKPVWVSMCCVKFKNIMFLFPTRNGDGIEAWLTLTEEDMDLVETNQELLGFASLDPSAIL